MHAARRSTASGTAQFATNLLPGLLVLGLGVGMVFVAVGSLTSPAGAVAGFSRAFVAAAIVAVLLAVVAFVKMPSTHVTGGGGNVHMH